MCFLLHQGQYHCRFTIYDYSLIFFLKIVRSDKFHFCIYKISISFSSLNALHSCYRLSVIAAPVINLSNSRKRCKSDHYSNHYNAVHRSEERKRWTAASSRRDDIIHTTRLFGLSNVIKYRGLSTFSLIVRLWRYHFTECRGKEGK